MSAKEKVRAEYPRATITSMFGGFGVKLHPAHHKAFIENTRAKAWSAAWADVASKLKQSPAMTTNPTPAMSDEEEFMAWFMLQSKMPYRGAEEIARMAWWAALHQQRAKDNAEGWHGHKFKEIRRGYWECECGTVLNEALITESETMTAEQQLAVSPPISAQVAVDCELVAQLKKFYSVDTVDEILSAQDEHIASLQEKLKKLTPSFSQPQRVPREG